MRRSISTRRSRLASRPGVADGVFRPMDTRLTAFAWLGMHNYTYLWLKPDGRLSARDVAAPFADIVTRGISAHGTE